MNKAESITRILGCMAIVGPIGFRLTLLSALIVFVLKSPCPCGALPSQADVSCCTSQPATGNGNQAPACGGCCSSSESSGSPRGGSKLCGASCSIDCKQAEAGSWKLGAQTLKVDLSVDTATQRVALTSVDSSLRPTIAEYEQVLPPSHRSINISTHLLRI